MLNKKTALLIAMTSILAACGSTSSYENLGTGGSSSSSATIGTISPGAGNSSASTSDNIGKDTPTTAVGDYVMLDKKANDGETRAYLVHKKENVELMQSLKFDSKADHIFIDGKELEKDDERLHKIEGKDKYQYVEDGYFWDTETKKGFLYALVDDPTPIKDMPTTGAVEYTGTAMVHAAELDTHATSKFEVNFAKKTLAATITSTKYDKHQFSANIKDNTFSGEGIKGGFAGPNAQRLAGTFANDKVFGTFVGSTVEE